MLDRGACRGARWARRFDLAFLVLVLAVALAGTDAFAAPREPRTGLAVAGSERVVVKVPAGVPVAAYENVGYRLQRRGGLAVVEVDAAPLASSAAAPAPRAHPATTPTAQLAQRLILGAESQYEAVSRVLAWVARNIRYDLDRRASQEAEDVLERREGYCTGIARLSVAMLEAAGIQAREVPGYVATGDDRAGYHRWIEVYYPDRGWVFSDPSSSHHFVPATYVRLAAEEVGLEASGEPERSKVEAREGGLQVVDVHPLAPPGVLARRNRPRQRASTVTVRIASQDGAEPAGTVTLRDGRHRRRRVLENGAATFVGLEGGSYALIAELASGVQWRQLEVESRSVLVVELSSSDESRASSLP